MRLRAILSQSLIVQSFGAVLGLLLVVVISHRFGPSGQGLYATARAWVDLASLVMLAGLPQALIHAISGGTLSVAPAARFILVFAGIVSLLLWGVTWAVPALGPPFQGTGIYTCLILAACFATLHGLGRVLVLTRRSFLLFNLITVTPSTALFVAAVSISAGDSAGFAEILALSFTISAAFAVAAILGPLFKDSSQHLSLANVVRLTRYGSWSLVTQAAPQSAVLGTYVGLRQGVTPEEVGFFSIVIVLISTITLPLSIVAPILFSRWTAEFAAGGRSPEFELCVSAFLVLSVAATAAIMPAVYWGIPVAFGDSFKPAISIYMFMGASTVLFVQHRILLTAGLAFNIPRECAISQVLRTVLIVSFVIAVPSLEVAVGAWWLGEILAIAYLTRPLVKTLGLTHGKVLGFNAAPLLNHWRHAR